jgi:transposase InsO family protein
VRDAHIWDRCSPQTEEIEVSWEGGADCPNKLQEEDLDLTKTEVVFSDILEVRFSDRSKVRGCFTLRHRTRQILGLAFDYHMRADLVTDTIHTMAFVLPGSIWHSDQGKQYGAEQTRQLLLHKGFVLSMSRAGTPTETGTGHFWEGKISILR